MSVIEYMNGQQLGDAIDIAGQAVSGMSYSEAAAALGGSTIGSSGATQIWTFPLSGGNSWKPVSLEAQYAAQTWQYYKTAAEAAGITSFGAAAVAGKTWAQGVLFGTGEGLAATGGLLTLSAPTAVAVAAPLLGVGIGGALYESNPELWTKISRAILPWCYEDTLTVPAAVDENGQVSIAKGLVDALKQLFQQEGILDDQGQIPTGGWTSSYGTGSLPKPILPVKSFRAIEGSYVQEVIAPEDGEIIVYVRPAGTSVAFICAAKSSSSEFISRFSTNGGNSWTTSRYTAGNYTSSHENKVAYYGERTTFLNATGIYAAPSTAPSNAATGNAAWTVLFGTESSSELPVGISEWTGTVPQTLPEIWIIVEPEISDPSTHEGMVPYTPVQLPEVQTPIDPSQYPVPVEDPDGPLPWESPDPEEQPDPQAPMQWPDITPWIRPEIPWQWPWELDEPEPIIDPETGQSTDPTKAPCDDPTQRQEPNIDIGRDPQQEPSPVPQPKPSPWGDDIPPSDGQSPDPVFPVIDIVPFPDLPMSDASGLIHVYNPSPSQMQSFGRWLWVTVQDAISQGQELIWNNPFDGVISAHELYATPTTGSAQNIRSGFLTSDVSAPVVTSRYNSINCGSIVVPEYWRNYLDYSPYTRVYCYLPFIGIVELDCDDIVGHAVNILYHVDSFSGACIAQVTIAKDGPTGETYCNTVYQFSGNCAVEVPIAGGTQAAIRAAQINAAAWGIGSVVSGIAQALTSPTIGGQVAGIVGGITGAMQARASVVSAKSSVQHSGSFGANFGAMGIKTPYLIVRRPIQKVVDNYNQDYGFPAHKMVQIGTCSGYLRVREVNVISATANDTEKRMIEQMLKEGVYVS